ncbi:MAG TPA: hypothetical protein VNI57_11620, partial [Candidatus Saccharimonadales bacterium]|nr:hypothetical protein [Candidatus Saccharimonadales bacterium]
DPVTREGIAPAMRSAAVLARALLASSARSLGETPVILPRGRVFVARPGHTNGNGAAAALRTPPLPDNLRLGHLYKKGFFKEEFVEKMVWMSAESRAIRKVLADLFDGRQGYEGLKRRLVINAVRCGLEIGLRSLFGKSRSGDQPAA